MSGDVLVSVGVLVSGGVVTLVVSTGESSESGVDCAQGSSSLWYSLLHCSVSFTGPVGASSSGFTNAYLQEGASSSA